MLQIYYSEILLVGICIAAVLLRQSRNHTSRKETSHIIFNLMLGTYIVMCFFDLIVYVGDGKQFPLGRPILYISNSLSFMGQCSITYLWMLFFMIRLRKNRYKSLQSMIAHSIPIGLVFISLIINIWTGWFFSIDSNNVYSRGDFIFAFWAVLALYYLGSLVTVIMSILHTSSSSRKKEYISYFSFFIPMLVGALFQAFFFGIATIQISGAISFLMLNLELKDAQIIRDDLTGLNNRRALNNYKFSLAAHDTEVNLTLFMMDVDNFKSINDTYGHLKGDEALKNVSRALKEALGNMPGNRMVIYRYAGDEFVVVGTNSNIEIINFAKRRITDQLKAFNKTGGEPYKLSMSIGVASGICKSDVDFERILKEADEDMYQQKMRKKARQNAISNNVTPSNQSENDTESLTKAVAK